MNEYFLKNPASELDYSFDWGTQILAAGEQISSDMGWTVTPDTAASGGLAVISLMVCAVFTAFTGASGVTIFAVGGLADDLVV